jgi:hypothetical protein
MLTRLCTASCLKLYVFDHVTGPQDTRTKDEERYQALQAVWDNGRIIDDLNDISVLVVQTKIYLYR